MFILFSAERERQDEHEVLQKAFDYGLETFHLRKPSFGVEDHRLWLKKLPKKFHPRIVIHSCYELAEEFGLKGIHLKDKGFLDRQKLWNDLHKRLAIVSASFHDFEEILDNNLLFEYIFLSPIFSSISKLGYSKDFDFDEIKCDIQDYKIPVVALGGINSLNLNIPKNFGFSGVAVLGAVWSSEIPFENFKVLFDLYSE